MEVPSLRIFNIRLYKTLNILMQETIPHWARSYNRSLTSSILLVCSPSSRYGSCLLLVCATWSDFSPLLAWVGFSALFLTLDASTPGDSSLCPRSEAYCPLGKWTMLLKDEEYEKPLKYSRNNKVHQNTPQQRNDAPQNNRITKRNFTGSRKIGKEMIRVN